MPLHLFISKHKVILTVTGAGLSVSLVSALVALTVALNDLAEILVKLAP